MWHPKREIIDRGTKNLPYIEDKIRDVGDVVNTLTIRRYNKETVDISYHIVGYGEVKIKNGDTIFLLENTVHRINGPAIIKSDGTSYWVKNGEIHREDGPAVYQKTSSSLFELYCVNGRKHRLDGPAVISPGLPSVQYWVDGIQLNEEEFINEIRRIKIKSLLE